MVEDIVLEDPPVIDDVDTIPVFEPIVDPLEEAGKKVNDVLINILKALRRTEEDPENDALALALQNHRTLLLEFATLSYVKNPNSSKMLEAVVMLTTAIEKSLRDDRKERAKLKENEDNRISFSQIVESINAMSKGAIIRPTFDLTSFILDPLNTDLDVLASFDPIKDDELVQGNGLVDINGDPITN